MHLENQRYIITATVETRPPLEHFDLVFSPTDLNVNDFYMARILEITSADGGSRSIALVDLLCAKYEPYAVLENDLLTVILFDAIVQIDLISGMITRCAQCDNWGGLHEIHGLEDGYLIWGEGDIFRYDRSLNLVWHFMGRDILVSPIMDKHFWIEDGLIHCRDFLGWHYILNFDGNLISDFREINDSEIQ